jgi:hypothetical protein
MTSRETGRRTAAIVAIIEASSAGGRTRIPCDCQIPNALWTGLAAAITFTERPRLSAPAHGTRELQPERDGRVRWSAELGGVVTGSLFVSAQQPVNPNHCPARQGW